MLQFWCGIFEFCANAEAKVVFSTSLAPRFTHRDLLNIFCPHYFCKRVLSSTFLEANEIFLRELSASVSYELVLFS